MFSKRTFLEGNENRAKLDGREVSRREGYKV